MKTTKFVRAAGWLATAGLLGAALIAPSITLATAPTDHQVTICHRTDSDANPYLMESVDIASSGHLQGGHDTEHQGPIWDATLKAQKIQWGDIIPSYTYQGFSYVGQNWTDQGQAILAAGCTIPTTTTTTTSQTTSSETAASTTADTTSQTTTSSADTTQTTSSETTAATTANTTSQATSADTTSATTTTAGPNGAVLGETGVPQITPPPTDTMAQHGTPVDGSWRMLLLLAAGILGSLLVLTPATARRRR